MEKKKSISDVWFMAFTDKEIDTQAGQKSCIQTLWKA